VESPKRSTKVGSTLVILEPAPKLPKSLPLRESTRVDYSLAVKNSLAYNTAALINIVKKVNNRVCCKTDTGLTQEKTTHTRVCYILEQK